MAGEGAGTSEVVPIEEPYVQGSNLFIHARVIGTLTGTVNAAYTLDRHEVVNLDTGDSTSHDGLTVVGSTPCGAGSFMAKLEGKGQDFVGTFAAVGTTIHDSTNTAHFLANIDVSSVGGPFSPTLTYSGTYLCTP
jgi:hypothetical protein